MKFTTLAASLVNPASKHEDARRREFILNVLLLALITLLTLAMVSSVITALHATKEHLTHDHMSLFKLLFVLGFFVTLYWLSRSGRARIASYIVIGILFLFSMYMAYLWGPDLPMGMLFYALTIVMAGILISSRFAFIVAVSFGLLIPSINYLQILNVIQLDSYWRGETFELSDAFVISIMLIIIATVSWLSNRELERSLKRARKSEADLKEERDLLEIRVHERTQELRQAELERISQSYRFIEFGRIASGIFHDLTNPLTSISLTIENISRSNDQGNSEYVTVLSQELHQAERSAKHMQNLLQTMRRHLSHEGSDESFSITRTAEDVVSMLEAYARQHEVELELDVRKDIMFLGDGVAFTQVLTNLVSNAIEYFPEAAKGNSRKRTVRVVILKKDGHVNIGISDTGSGIPKEILTTIFEPFVTTKGAAGGLGIGLSLVKQIVERNFRGTIVVASEVGKGTIFTVELPVREP